ncbi:MAG: glycosyltransferase family 4 protein [Flavobacteriales bacterium]
MKPQVLVFIDWYSPGFKAGGPVRSMVNMVDHLRDRVDFHIVTSDTEYTEETPYPDIVPDEWTTLPGGERVWYASKSGINKAVWQRLLKQKPWDTIYINGLYSRWFSIMPLWLTLGTAKRRVVAARGMLASGMMEHGRFKKRSFLAMMRTFGCYKGVEFQATNAEEVEDIKHWLEPDSSIHLVPNLGRKLVNGVPVDREKKPGELRLVSVARIAVEKNTLFAIECLAGLRGKVEYDLYGPIYDEAYWQQCQEAIAKLPPNIRVAHKGTIHPDEVPALFTRYHLLFMPSQGENFGHTMAEALAAGLPLLISDRTPWRDLVAMKAGWDLQLDRPQVFTATLRQLIDMPEEEHLQLRHGAFALAARYLADSGPVEKTLSLLTR